MVPRAHFISFSTHALDLNIIVTVCAEISPSRCAHSAHTRLTPYHLNCIGRFLVRLELSKMCAVDGTLFSLPNRHAANVYTCTCLHIINYVYRFLSRETHKLIKAIGKLKIKTEYLEKLYIFGLHKFSYLHVI